MKEVEELLRRDRAAGVPDPPDVRYTVAAINRRLGRLPAARQQPKDSEWLLVLVAFCLLVVVVLYVGVNPWWLAAISLAALCMTPILLRKGA
jgi:Flp pilus assembly protein TadB